MINLQRRGAKSYICLFWLTSATWIFLKKEKNHLQGESIYYTSKIEFICAVVQSDSFLSLLNSQVIICFGDSLEALEDLATHGTRAFLSVLLLLLRPGKIGFSEL